MQATGVAAIGLAPRDSGHRSTSSIGAWASRVDRNRSSRLPVFSVSPELSQPECCGTALSSIRSGEGGERERPLQEAKAVVSHSRCEGPRRVRSVTNSLAASFTVSARHKHEGRRSLPPAEQAPAPRSERTPWRERPRCAPWKWPRACPEGSLTPWLSVSVSALMIAPPCPQRLGRSVRYLPSDVADFVRASAVDTTSVSSSDGESEIGELPL